MEEKIYPYKIIALKDRPLGGNVKKGEVGIHIGMGYYKFPNVDRYSASSLSGFEVFQEEEEVHYEIY